MSEINQVGIDNVLGQLRALQARSQDVAGPEAGSGSEFGQLLSNTLQSVNERQKTAADMSAGFVAGDPDVDIAEAMLALNRADASFKALTEVRNRLVSSYQDIMNMPI